MDGETNIQGGGGETKETKLQYKHQTYYVPLRRPDRDAGGVPLNNFFEFRDRFQFIRFIVTTFKRTQGTINFI